MVSIAAFQAVDPGSIPGHRIIFYLWTLSYYFNKTSLIVNRSFNLIFLPTWTRNRQFKWKTKEYVKGTR